MQGTRNNGWEGQIGEGGCGANPQLGANDTQKSTRGLPCTAAHRNPQTGDCVNSGSVPCRGCRERQQAAAYVKLKFERWIEEILSEGKVKVLE
jgi:hypothetical protein